MTDPSQRRAQREAIQDRAVNQLLADILIQREQFPTDPSINDYVKALKDSQAIADKLRDLVEDLASEVCQLRAQLAEEKAAKKKKGKGKGDLEEEPMLSLDAVITLRAQLYVLQYGLWITPSALEVSPRPSPPVDIWSPDRFADDVAAFNAEVEQVYLSFTTFPEDLVPSRAEELQLVMGIAPSFTKTFYEALQSMRYVYINRGRDVVAKLAAEFPGVHPDAWSDPKIMAKDPIAKALVGDANTTFPDILFEPGLEQNRAGFLKRRAIPLLPRAAYFGPASIGGKKPDSRVIGIKGHFKTLTPAVYAGAAVIIIFVLSGDPELTRSTGAVTNINYEERFYAILEFVMRHWNDMEPQHEYWKSTLLAKVASADRASVSTTVSANDAAFLAQWNNMTFDNAPRAPQGSGSSWDFSSPSKTPARTRPGPIRSPSPTPSHFPSDAAPLVLSYAPHPQAAALTAALPARTPVHEATQPAHTLVPKAPSANVPAPAAVPPLHFPAGVAAPHASQRDTDSVSSRDGTAASGAQPSAPPPPPTSSATASSRSRATAPIAAPPVLDNDVADDIEVQLPPRRTRQTKPSEDSEDSQRAGEATNGRGRGGKVKSGARGAASKKGKK